MFIQALSFSSVVCCDEVLCWLGGVMSLLMCHLVMATIEVMLDGDGPVSLLGEVVGLLMI